MGFMDKIRGKKASATLPTGAKVARRRYKRGGGTEVGYWHNNSFYLLDGSLANSYEYVDGTGEVLGTSAARVELNDAGYDADQYVTPSYGQEASHSSYPSSDYDSGSYSSGSSYSHDSGSGSYSYGGSSDSGSSYGGSSSSSDSGSSSSYSD